MSFSLVLQIVHDRGFQMQFRLKPLLACLLSGLMLGGSLVAFVPAAQAATPPFEPDPNARAGVVFYDAAGHVVTGGSIDDSPVAAYVQATAPGRSTDNTATLFGYLAPPGVATGRSEEHTSALKS